MTGGIGRPSLDRLGLERGLWLDGLTTTARRRIRPTVPDGLAPLSTFLPVSMVLTEDVGRVMLAVLLTS
jgi:hypothetical protein